MTEPTSQGYWTIGGRNFYRRIQVPAAARANMLASTAVTFNLTSGSQSIGAFVITGSNVSSEFQFTGVNVGLVGRYSGGYLYFSRARTAGIGTQYEYIEYAVVSWT